MNLLVGMFINLLTFYCALSPLLRNAKISLLNPKILNDVSGLIKAFDYSSNDTLLQFRKCSKNIPGTLFPPKEKLFKKKEKA